MRLTGTYGVGGYPVSAITVVVYWQDHDEEVASIWSIIDAGGVADSSKVGPTLTTAVSTAASNLTAGTPRQRPSATTVLPIRTSWAFPSGSTSSNASVLLIEPSTAAMPHSIQLSTRILRDMRSSHEIDIPLACIAILFMTVAGFTLRRKRRIIRSAKTEDESEAAEMEVKRRGMMINDRGPGLADTGRQELEKKVGIELPA